MVVGIVNNKNTRTIIRTVTRLDKNAEELFIAEAINDLKKGLTTYVYKEHILNELKKVFNNLDIRRNEFYWTVRNKEVSK